MPINPRPRARHEPPAGTAPLRATRAGVGDVGPGGRAGVEVGRGRDDPPARWFLVQPPADTAPPHPVLLVLHGGGQSMHWRFAADAGATRGWPELARRENALLLVPNGVDPDNADARGDNQTWNDLREGVSRASSADDVAFLVALLAWEIGRAHV